MQRIFNCSRRLLISLLSIHIPQPSLCGLAAERSFVTARWTVSRTSALIVKRNMAENQEPSSKRKRMRIGGSALHDNVNAFCSVFYMQ